jgi:membrane associated rhomboid family serine protease
VLILPLHRPLTAATFPFATALLVLLNVLVYFGGQAGDDEIREEAARYWQESGLGSIEAPAYATWHAAHAGAARVPDSDLEVLPEDVRALVAIQQDPAFLDDLRAGRAITPQDPDYARWRPLRTEFDRLWDRSFTDRNLLRFGELSLRRMFMAMFLHGDAGHLFGNMLFLAFVGLLVEGALGSRQFLALYVLGGLGAQLASLAWRSGEIGSALGASGAIAALMGAFCVLWGRRKVRFFWWFFVVFDYVRAPALWLLPVWLGWEVVNLLWNEGAGVGFDAHAGGILSGAGLAAVVVLLGRERRDYLDADDAPAVSNARAVVSDASFQQALAHLARLETAQARALLAPLAAAPDAAPPVRVAWYRCCRYDPATGDVHAAALRVLQARGDAGAREERAQVLDDYLKAQGGRAGFAAAAGVAVAREWIDSGSPEDAARLLAALEDADGAAGVADAWLALARRWHDANRPDRARAVCEEVQRRFPDSPAAAKAAFLLASVAG